MELIVVDFSIWLLSLIVASTIFAFYAFTTISYFSHEREEGFPVINLIRTLKKVCPVGFGNKWRLLSQPSGVSRCWTKTIQFPGFQSSTQLCGTACSVSCSSMYAFSLIADVAKWGEWEPLPTTQCLTLKPLRDKLKKDAFMQADQVVGIQRGTDVQSFTAMYRFMSFQEKTVKWILFWNAKKLEFMFFLIQPAVSKTVESQCVITHIYASLELPPHITSLVAQRLRNIKDFLILSQIHVVSSKYAPAIPVVPTARWYCDSPLNKPSASEQCSAVLPESSIDSAQEAFVLMPVLCSLKYVYRKVKGYHLAIKRMSGDLAAKKEKKKVKEPSTNPPSTEFKETLKRSVSDTCIKPLKREDFKSSWSVSPPSNTKKPSHLKSRTSIIVEENLILDVGREDQNGGASLATEKGRNISESGMPDVEVRKSFSQSDCSELQTDEETYINLHVIHEDVAQENLSPDRYDKNDIFCSSTSDFELLDSNQQFLDCKIADFLTQGNYGASELQAEMMLASHFNKVLSSEVQFSGGWIYHSTCKGITVLAKTTTGQVMKIVSFLCQIEMPVDCNDVWKCVKNPRFRFISDETVKTVEIIERISNSQKLIHIYHETSGFLKKESIDFCLLQTEREEVNSYYSSFHSIEYGKCPFMTSVTRGSLRPSGWVVERLRPERCRVTHMMQILVSSPDSIYIQELSNLVPLAMHNLRTYLASMPKSIL